MQIKKILLYLPLIICLLIIVHHYIKHKNDFHLTIFEKFFQISDIMNHESFVFLFFGIFIGLFISKFNYSNMLQKYHQYYLLGM